jgi:ankyrin repeat protein
LYKARSWANNVTNLDFVELLLEEGADPNGQDQLGLTPLLWINKE